MALARRVSLSVFALRIPIGFSCTCDVRFTLGFQLVRLEFMRYSSRIGSQFDALQVRELN